MRGGKGKRVAISAAVAGALVLLAAVFALRGWIREEWYLRKLGSGDGEAKRLAAEKLGELKSIRAIPVLAGLVREATVDPYPRGFLLSAGTTADQHGADTQGRHRGPGEPRGAFIARTPGRRSKRVPRRPDHRSAVTGSTSRVECSPDFGDSERSEGRRPGPATARAGCEIKGEAQPGRQDPRGLTCPRPCSPQASPPGPSAPGPFAPRASS
jgi:hypothetical protein